MQKYSLNRFVVQKRNIHNPYSVKAQNTGYQLNILSVLNFLMMAFL